MEVSIVCKENVKPSAQTPPHLRSFKLCHLDQLIPSSYAPIVFFYQNDNTIYLDAHERLNHLKRSLSETLTSFYPLAGKIKDDLFIECNDEGANFIETKVNCCLNEFLSKPAIPLVNKFLPCQELVAKESLIGTHVSNIQANVFACGGIAIGICIAHRMLDGTALSTFLKAWTRSSNGFGEQITPGFVASSLFPANDSWLKESSNQMWGSLFKTGNSITRRFMFDNSSIDILKAQGTKPGLKSPTRVEAVSAFLWKCTMQASAELHGYSRPSFLTHIVNLRKRFAPPLSEHSIGNLIWMAVAKCKAKSKPELSELVGKVKEAIAEIDDNFANELRGENGHFVMSKTFKEVSEQVSEEAAEFLLFSSWCNMRFYDVDFGWGKPVWVSSIGLEGPVVLNLVMFIDTRLGDGIETWITLDQQQMTLLANNQDLLKFASLDPSPLLRT